MVPMEFILKLQGLQAFSTEAVGIFFFYKYTFFITERYRTALAFCNITNFAFKGFAASRTGFAFMLWHTITS